MLPGKNTSREKVRKIKNLVKKTFPLDYRKTILFLPGTFRDCGILEGVFSCATFLSKSRRKSVDAPWGKRKKIVRKSRQTSNL